MALEENGDKVTVSIVDGNHRRNPFQHALVESLKALKIMILWRSVPGQLHDRNVDLEIDEMPRKWPSHKLDSKCITILFKE